MASMTILLPEVTFHRKPSRRFQITLIRQFDTDKKEFTKKIIGLSVQIGRLMILIN